MVGFAFAVSRDSAGVDMKWLGTDMTDDNEERHCNEQPSRQARRTHRFSRLGNGYDGVNLLPEVA